MLKKNDFTKYPRHKLKEAGQHIENGRTILRFIHFDLDMRFAPQCGALFRHLISENEVVCTFWLEHALCATSAGF